MILILKPMKGGFSNKRNACDTPYKVVSFFGFHLFTYQVIVNFFSIV